MLSVVNHNRFIATLLALGEINADQTIFFFFFFYTILFIPLFTSNGIAEKIHHSNPPTAPCCVRNGLLGQVICSASAHVVI